MEQRYEDVLILLIVGGTFVVGYVVGRWNGRKVERQAQADRIRRTRRKDRWL